MGVVYFGLWKTKQDETRQGKSWQHKESVSWFWKKCMQGEKRAQEQGLRQVEVCQEHSYESFLYISE